MNFDIPDLEQATPPVDPTWFWVLGTFIMLTILGLIFFTSISTRKIRRALYISSTLVLLVLGGILVVLIPTYREAADQNQVFQEQQRTTWASQFVSETERLYGLTISEQVAWDMLEGWEFKTENFNEGLDAGIYWEADNPVSLFHDGAHIQVELAWLGDRFALIHYEADPEAEVRELEPATTE